VYFYNFLRLPFETSSIIAAEFVFFCAAYLKRILTITRHNRKNRINTSVVLMDFFDVSQLTWKQIR